MTPLRSIVSSHYSLGACPPLHTPRRRTSSAPSIIQAEFCLCALAFCLWSGAPADGSSGRTCRGFRSVGDRFANASRDMRRSLAVLRLMGLSVDRCEPSRNGRSAGWLTEGSTFRAVPRSPDPPLRPAVDSRPDLRHRDAVLSRLDPSPDQPFRAGGRDRCASSISRARDGFADLLDEGDRYPGGAAGTTVCCSSACGPPTTLLGYADCALDSPI